MNKTFRTRATGEQERRSEMLRIKATASEKQLILEACRVTGETASDFMRKAIQRALQEYQITVSAPLG